MTNVVIDITKLRTVCKTIVDHEALVDSEPQYYEGGDPTPKSVYDDYKYLNEVRQEILPVLRILAGCGELKTLVGTVDDIRRWTREIEDYKPETELHLHIDRVDTSKGIQFSSSLEMMEFKKPSDKET